MDVFALDTPDELVEQRKDAARQALRIYALHTNEQDEPIDSVVTDLVTDLLHLVDDDTGETGDGWSTLERVEMHYRAEA